MPQLDQQQLSLWLTVLNTVGVIAVLLYGLRLFLSRTLVTNQELQERLASREEERKRLEADRDAWRSAAEKNANTLDRVTDEFQQAVQLLRESKR